MLAVVDNQLAVIQPLLDTEVAYELTAKDGRLQVNANGVRVEAGVTFFRMTNHRRSVVDPVTGQYEIEGKAPTVFRALFANQHIDLEVWP